MSDNPGMEMEMEGKIPARGLVVVVPSTALLGALRGLLALVAPMGSEWGTVVELSCPAELVAGIELPSALDALVEGLRLPRPKLRPGRLMPIERGFVAELVGTGVASVAVDEGATSLEEASEAEEVKLGVAGSEVDVSTGAEVSTELDAGAGAEDSIELDASAGVDGSTAADVSGVTVSAGAEVSAEVNDVACWADSVVETVGLSAAKGKFVGKTGLVWVMVCDTPFSSTETMTKTVEGDKLDGAVTGATDSGELSTGIATGSDGGTVGKLLEYCLLSSRGK